jgi:serine/threonine-protein kinase
MTAAEWAHVKRLLEEALALAPESRAAFVARAGDPALKATLTALLAAHAEAGDFLESRTAVDHLAAAVLDDDAHEPALAAGSRLGPYEVVELLEVGGMGEVYRARDPRLGRDVALKVMRPWLSGDRERMRRFEAEARAAGALNDPNILAVYDVGSADGMPYIVSELLQGESLGRKLRRERLTRAQALEYAIGIAQGLAAAHAKGIVHRDLKPDNVFLTGDGRVKLLDFGVAKLLEDASVDSGAALSRGATDSTVIGTPGYIAPERLAGLGSDHRADIFALGAILYQMLSGRSAFGTGGDTAGHLRATLVREAAPFSPDDGVPPALERVVRRCLAKQPEDRYPSAEPLRRALQALSPARASTARRAALAVAAVAALAAAASFLDVARRPRAGREDAEARPIRSLAVLPLLNASGDPDQDYFADGLTDALIAEMARTKGLRVLSRASAQALKDAGRGRAEVASRLGVDALVEGSVRRTGPQVSVAVALLRPPADERVWAANYDRDARDVFELQRDVAGAILTEIAVVAPPSDGGAARRPPPDVEAYEAYLRGRHYWNMRTAEAAPKALAQFNRALALDPLYAPAYAGLADTYLTLGDMLYLMPHRDAFARGEAAALRAIELDPSQAAAYASLGHLRMHAWQWEDADRAFQRALALDPGYASALQWRAYDLASMGRMDAALASIERAQAVDPLSLIVNADRAELLWFGGRYAEAIEQSRKTLQMDPDFAEAHRILFLALQRTGRAEEALAGVEAYRRLRDGGIGGSVGYAYGRLGRPAEAETVLHELEERARKSLVPAYDLAAVEAGLGHTDRALTRLEESVATQDPESMILPVDPRMDSLRGQPRLAALLARMGLRAR